jgi:hypothetical protein
MQPYWFITTFNKLRRAFFNKASISPRIRFSEIFLEDFTQWIPLLPIGGE